MEPFRVLAGLPGTGPWPEQFSTTGRGTHREGFVVEFNTDTDSAWVGNFQRGWTSYEAVFLHPDDQSVIVIAGGQGYVVDLKDRRAVGILSDQLESAIVLPDLKAVVLNNGIRLEAYGKAGLLWRTPRISWDGIWDFREEAG
ncbi:MAG TPA: hypothetical protein VKE70_20350, partial [Candidatus Solibacter sp.]|nr:hypothetical protein [Candidatus Solibacter sp.]